MASCKTICLNHALNSSATTCIKIHWITPCVLTMLTTTKSDHIVSLFTPGEPSRFITSNHR
nr:MAG TPA_asm: hypothetical protein [Caudoviricetes sp.]